jgi:hypothetical protein
LIVYAERKEKKFFASHTVHLPEHLKTGKIISSKLLLAEALALAIRLRGA